MGEISWGSQDQERGAGGGEPGGRKAVTKEPLQFTVFHHYRPTHDRCAYSLSFLAPLFFLLFFAFSLGFSFGLSIMDFTGFLAFSESSNFFMVVGARILLLSSASLKGKETDQSHKKGQFKLATKVRSLFSHVPFSLLYHPREGKVSNKLRNGGLYGAEVAAQ